jgi:segregation and condensation protein B
VSTDERQDSLAAQAAAWVPPWERQQRPDRAYQAAAMAESAAAESAEGESAAGEWAAAESAEGESASAESEESAEPGHSAQPDQPAEPERPAEPEAASDPDEVPPELAPLPGEADEQPAVDAPVEVPDDDAAGPTDVGGIPEVPLPTPVEDAGEQALEEERGPSVDAPLLNGDDAGDVFDAAADDDISDDGELDMPLAEEVPETDEPDPDQDVPLADESPSGGDGTVPEVEEPDTDGVQPEDSFGARAAFAAGAADAEAALAEAPAAQRAQPRSTVPTQGRGSQGPPDAVGEEDARTRNDSDLPPLDDPELRAALEAILLVVDEPVAEMQLAQIMEQPTERVAAMLEDISARYTAAGHGFDLRRAAGGWRLYTRPEYAPYVERFVLDGQSVRLTQAALETLAVVAYKQPVTRSRISAIRGVNCDGVMRTLVTRGLIEECGTEGETGAYLYRTTPMFLEKLGLNSVDELPPLAPFLPDDVEEVFDASG